MIPVVLLLLGASIRPVEISRTALFPSNKPTVSALGERIHETGKPLPVRILDASTGKAHPAFVMDVLDGQSLVLSDHPSGIQPRTISLSQVQGLEVKRTSTSFGFPLAIAGGVIGGLIGATIVDHENRQYYSPVDPLGGFGVGLGHAFDSVNIAGGATLGAMIGGLTGGLLGSRIHKDTWQRVPLEDDPNR